MPTGLSVVLEEISVPTLIYCQFCGEQISVSTARRTIY